MVGQKPLSPPLLYIFKMEYPSLLYFKCFFSKPIIVYKKSNTWKELTSLPLPALKVCSVVMTYKLNTPWAGTPMTFLRDMNLPFWTKAYLALLFMCWCSQVVGNVDKTLLWWFPTLTIVDDGRYLWLCYMPQANRGIGLHNYHYHSSVITTCLSANGLSPGILTFGWYLNIVSPA